MSDRMFHIGDDVLVIDNIDTDHAGCVVSGSDMFCECEGIQCPRHGIGHIGERGMITGTLTDDHGARPSSPGFFVSNRIGLMWPEELLLVESVAHDTEERELYDL